MSLTTCRKTYTDIPWAHRQHKHDGHCSLIHGHNWGISITFGCLEPDENGFVVDFGKLKSIKAWIEQSLDHACVLSSNDPYLEKLNSVGGKDVWKMYIVPNCSSEGISKHLFEVFDPIVREITSGRAFVIAVEVTEDSKNSASFSIPSYEIYNGELSYNVSRDQG